MQACDRDIIAGLQKLKAFALRQEGDLRWFAADEGLCTAALEHMLLTCIERGISLSAFQAAEMMEALQAASDDLSCALIPPFLILNQVVALEMPLQCLYMAGATPFGETPCTWLLPHVGVLLQGAAGGSRRVLSVASAALLHEPL